VWAWIQQVKLSYGNHWEEIAKPAGCNKKNLKQANRWCMYVTINNDRNLTIRYIKKVTYFIHHAHRMNEIAIMEPPFLLSRSAFGKFIVKLEITFQDWMDLEKVTVDHALKFTESGSIFEKLIDTPQFPDIRPHNFEPEHLESEQKIIQQI
jgi:transcription initiation factor IIF auxiliary subunit